MSTGPRGSSVGGQAVPDAAIREQLARLLASPQLVHSHSLARLLQFVVDETLEGRDAQLKEVRLGLEVFNRPSHSYDSAIDPIVRVQMGRLRTRLRNYYDTDGANDPVAIDIARGGYVPSFGMRLPGARDGSRAEGYRADAPGLRLAVLPFVNMSSEPDNEYFSDGLTEELINRLARDRRLHVVARTSSFQFKGAARDIRDIARQLEVGTILEGSVRRSANRVRVTADLINAADACHVWSERYEGEVTDIFAIQDEIACAIQQALHTQLLGGNAERPAVNDTDAIAHNHYLQGRFLWNKRTGQGLRAAIDHFARAIGRDPRFARAYSGMADCHLMLAMSAAEAPDRSMPEARAAALKALELDDSLAEAHASLAAVRNCYEWNRAGADAEYRHSLARDPNYATAHHWYGLFQLATAGRLSEATEELEWAIELDPLATPIIADLALVTCFRGDHEGALDQCRRALELDPHFHRPYWFLGLTHATRGDFDSAEAALKQALDLCTDQAFRSRVLGAIGYCNARSGRKRRADGLVQEMTQTGGRHYVSQFDVAQVHAGREDVESALASLEAAVEMHESFAIFLDVWPLFRSLREEPRFRRLVATIEHRT